MKDDCKGVGKQNVCRWDGNLDGKLLRCTHHQAEWIRERNLDKRVAAYREHLINGPLTPEDVAMHAMQSEAMLWLMVGSNHVESQLKSLRQYWEKYLELGGKSWGKQ